MITGVWCFLHVRYNAKHVFISPSQEPHKGDDCYHQPSLQVRLRELVWFVLSHIPRSKELTS